MPLQPGDKLGPYEILAPIGAGGMGEVYRARDPRLNRAVAIKVSNERFSDRFEREARVIAALNHPNICHLHDVGANYLVMELIEGAPLKGPMPAEKAVEYAGEILDALDAAHRSGFTHRDLKPANILVTKHGIKLLDFGLAKQNRSLKEADATVTSTLTQCGQILGTLHYMAPEQLQGKETDARSDLFSFGCVLYEMLSGKRAFEGFSAASVIAAILEREPAPLEVNPPLDRVIRICLAKDPNQRFQNALDLKLALQWAIERQPIPPPVHRWRWAATAALISIGVFAGWAFSHFRQPSADPRVLSLQIAPPAGTRFDFGSTTGKISLSPDGKNLAFIATGNSKSGLWVRSLESTEARLIPRTENAGYPFWSPDGKSLGFISANSIRRVDLAGESPQTICDAPGARDGDWSNDGQILFSASRSALFRVPASGGKPIALTTLDASSGERAHRMPQPLPGGRFLYWILTGKPETTGVYIGSLAKPADRIFLFASETNAVYVRDDKNDDKNKDYLLWLRGQTLLAQELNTASLKLVGEPHPLADPVATSLATNYLNAEVSSNGLLVYSSSGTVNQPRWFDRTGRLLGTAGEPGGYWMFRLSPDGRRVAAVTDSALWLLDVDRGVASRFTDNVRPMFPVWSQDGRTILYLLSRAPEIWRKASTGVTSGERILPQANWTITDWSRDGRFVLYTEVDPRTLRDLWILPVTPDGRVQPGAEPTLYLRTPFNESQGRFAPDPSPRWIAYQSDESGRYEIYIQSFPDPHGATRISTSGGQYPQWSPDGRELFYVSPDHKLMVVSIKLGADSVQPSAPHELFTLPADDLASTFSPYEVAPDGQRFLVRTESEQITPLTVVMNWPALLKKKSAAP
jgi:eukaryotic-like serine/threonine-protein kinase